MYKDVEFAKTRFTLSLAFQITDADIPKEATPDDYAKIVLPLLLKNGVVHFLGFANRLGFDPLPFELQVGNLSHLEF